MKIKLPLSFKDYSDIFNSVRPILNELKEDYELEGACIPLNFFAYAILRENFKQFNSYFMVGNVIYRIEENTLCYYDFNDHESPNNWHTFIFLDDYNNNRYYLDFTAPLFLEILKKKTGFENNIERKMFQKNISEAQNFDSDNIQKFIDGNVNDGDFSFIVDDMLRKKMIKYLNINKTIQECADLAVKLFNSKSDNILISVKNFKQELMFKTITKTNFKIEKAW